MPTSHDTRTWLEVTCDRIANEQGLSTQQRINQFNRIVELIIYGLHNHAETETSESEVEVKAAVLAFTLAFRNRLLEIEKYFSV